MNDRSNSCVPANPKVKEKVKDKLKQNGTVSWKDKEMKVSRCQGLKVSMKDLWSSFEWWRDVLFLPRRSRVVHRLFSIDSTPLPRKRLNQKEIEKLKTEYKREMNLDEYRSRSSLRSLCQSFVIRSRSLPGQINESYSFPSCLFKRLKIR